MKSSETKKKCPYVERDISWMYFNQRILLEAARPEVRSEERRVGKECRSRWSPYH